MTSLQMYHVSHSLGIACPRYEVLRDASLTVRQNEFVAIMGFSGSGKSTIISLLAGLQTPEFGEVRFHGRINAPPGPERGVVFQNYSLLPWLTVFGNIELAVRQVFRDWTRAACREHVQKFVAKVGLAGSERKRPSELSGGMRQRVSLARTLATEPDVLLLDEPLSALDALTRAVLQDELVRMWEEDKRTMVLVTNDMDEAVLMADRIVPLTRGPQAHFGPEVVVDIPRPRHRAELNFNPRFRELRHELTAFLAASSAESMAKPCVLGPPPSILPCFHPSSKITV